MLLLAQSSTTTRSALLECLCHRVQANSVLISLNNGVNYYKPQSRRCSSHMYISKSILKCIIAKIECTNVDILPASVK